LAHISVNTTLPLLPLQEFGQVGAETAALFLAIVTMCFLVRLAAGPVKFRHVLALIPVIGSVFLADQRAVIVNLAAVVLVVVVGMMVGPRPGVARKLFAAPGQVFLIFLAVAAIVIAIVVVPAAVERRPAQIPLASNFQSLFHSGGKAESAQDRLNLFAEAGSLIPHHLFIGYGLGVEFPYYETGTRSVQTIAYAHNLVLDLWLRLGLIGLGIFAAALAVSVKGGLRVWRRGRDRQTAVLALGLVAVVAGLFATGLLEPLLDEYRFTVLLGVGLGMLRGCVIAMGERPPLPGRPLEVTASRFAVRGSRETR
jgi:O-antigen ligase